MEIKTKVIKRDNSVQDYKFSKIENAVIKAFNSVNNFSDEEITKFISYLNEVFSKTLNKNLANNKDSITVEEIQDIIQNELIKKNKYDVVEAFIIYRKEHAEARQEKSKLIKDINKALNATDIQNQNANVDEASFGGRIGEAGRIVCKDRALKNMSKMARKNHENNMIYIHDLDSYQTGMHNCLSVPFDDLLANGFTTRQTDVRPASSINTAMQLVAVIFQLQSLQQFGGVSATHLDWTMVPYVRKSFYKHYINGLKYVEGWSDKKIDKFQEKLINKNNKFNFKDKFMSFYKKLLSFFKYA